MVLEMDSSDFDSDYQAPNLVELQATLQLPPELLNVPPIPIDLKPGWFIY